MVRLSVSLFFLLGVFLVAATFLLGVSAAPPSGAAPSGAALPSVAETEAEVMKAINQRMYPELVARPPFSPERRPYSEPEQAATDEDAAPEAREARPGRLDAQLLGIIDEGAGRVAVLAVAGARQTVFVKRGAAVEGWTVENVHKDHVVLKQNGIELTIKLYQ